MRTSSVDLEERQYELVAEMADNGDAPSQSEAIRNAIEHYGHEMGYINGEKKDTQLLAVIRRFADAFGVAGIVWIGLSFLYPIEIRALAIPIFAIAVALHGLAKGLERVEPGVSGWVNGVLRGDDA